MSGSGTIQIKKIWELLDACAPGYKKYPHGDHKWDVHFGTKRFPRLPLGGHGRKRKVGRADVELGHMRAMCRQFGITECVAKLCPQIAY